jgi:hypothetical protein
LDTTIQIDYEAARKAAIAQHGSLEALILYKAHLSVGSPEVHAYLDAVVAEGAAGHSIDHLQQPASYLRGGKVDAAIWCAVVVRVPRLDKALQEIEWGFFCKGCKEQDALHWHCRILYTNKTFEKHLNEYGSIEDGVHQSP